MNRGIFIKLLTVFGDILRLVELNNSLSFFARHIVLFALSNPFTCLYLFRWELQFTGPGAINNDEKNYQIIQAEISKLSTLP